MVNMTDVEEKLLKMLEDVGYSGPILEPDKLSQSLKLGAKSPDFTGLIAWFAEQLATFIDIDETVHATTSADDASSFLLELSFFLKEIGCVNEKLTSGNVNQRLANEAERAILIEFLAAELMACKLLEVKCPKEEKQMEVTVDESDTARSLKNMLITLKLQKPPDNISPEAFFSKVEAQLSNVLNTVPSEHIGKSLIDFEMSQKQWRKLLEVRDKMQKEYSIRREMLLKRLDVTLQSFMWSGADKRSEILKTEMANNKRFNDQYKSLTKMPRISLADLLAARNDLAIIEKTSNASVRKNTRSKINSVIIGAVPDRGGRPYEQEPPPPEMPPWQKDRIQGPPSFRGGRGGGGGGGGRGGGGGGRGGGGGGGGYRDHKDASNNFGQNLNYQQQSQYSGHGHRECYPDHRNAGGYQGGSGGGGGRGGGNYRDSNTSYNQNYSQSSGQNYSQNSGQNYGQSYSQSYSQNSDQNYNQGSSQNYGQSYGQGSGQTYQQSQYSGQRDSYGGDNRSGGNYYQDRREGGGGRAGGGGGSGRVQGGWNQGGNNSDRNTYQRGGRGKRRQY